MSVFFFFFFFVVLLLFFFFVVFFFVLFCFYFIILAELALDTILLLRQLVIFIYTLMIGLDSYSRQVFNYFDTILIYISL